MVKPPKFASINRAEFSFYEAPYAEYQRRAAEKSREIIFEGI